MWKYKYDTLHCLAAANMTRCNLSTLFSDIEGERTVNSGVTLLAPSSYSFEGIQISLQRLQNRSSVRGSKMGGSGWLGEGVKLDSR